MRQKILLLLLVSATAVAAQPVPSRLGVAPAAKALFDRDWVLMNWALKFHDTNRDIALQPDEAAAAALEFRKLADSDDDGRVTSQEYRSAREFILARY